MKRRVPDALYEEVYALVTDIAQPFGDPLDNVDESRSRNAYEKLLAVFRRQEVEGSRDPFLTEALADFTDDSAKAIRLNHLALEQCGEFPEEVTYTKRIGLAHRLVEAGRDSEARIQVADARREAFAAHDTEVMAELDDLAAKLAV